MTVKAEQSKKTGFKEEVPPYTPQQAILEASKCLLCYDPPCTNACPAGIDAGKFIRQIRFKNLTGAARTIRKDNPLGGICARVCPTEQLCMEACYSAALTVPIEIGRLQRFVTDLELKGEIDPIVLLEIIHQPIDDSMVKIITPQVGISVCRFDLEYTFPELENRDIEGASA